MNAEMSRAADQMVSVCRRTVTHHHLAAAGSRPDDYGTCPESAAFWDRLRQVRFQGLPADGFTLALHLDCTDSEADDLAQRLRSAGCEVAVDHCHPRSGKQAVTASYDPETDPFWTRTHN